jgi:membrane protease YdiL (CAAX protease family)
MMLELTDFVIPSYSIGIVTITFLMYLYLSQSQSIHKWFDNHYNQEGAQLRKVVFQRLIGAFLFGIGPFLVIKYVYHKNLSDFGLEFKTPSAVFFWLFALIPLVIFLNYREAKKPHNLALYPQIKVTNWNLGIFVLSALSWAVYMLGYEIMFRGFLFFSCYHIWGLVPSIIINVSLYSLAHLLKGKTETLGAFPFGIIVCWFTAQTGVIWFAFWLHLSLALTNEWFSLKQHPDITFRVK